MQLHERSRFLLKGTRLAITPRQPGTSFWPYTSQYLYLQKRTSVRLFFPAEATIRSLTARPSWLRHCGERESQSKLLLPASECLSWRRSALIDAGASFFFFFSLDPPFDSVPYSCRVMACLARLKWIAKSRDDYALRAGRTTEKTPLSSTLTSGEMDCHLRSRRKVI